MTPKKPPLLSLVLLALEIALFVLFLVAALVVYRHPPENARELVENYHLFGVFALWFLLAYDALLFLPAVAGAVLTFVLTAVWGTLLFRRKKACRAVYAALAVAQFLVILFQFFITGGLRFFFFNIPGRALYLLMLGGIIASVVYMFTSEKLRVWLGFPPSPKKKRASKKQPPANSGGAPPAPGNPIVFSGFSCRGTRL